MTLIYWLKQNYTLYTWMIDILHLLWLVDSTAQFLAVEGIYWMKNDSNVSTDGEQVLLQHQSLSQWLVLISYIHLLIHIILKLAPSMC